MNHTPIHTHTHIREFEYNSLVKRTRRACWSRVFRMSQNRCRICEIADGFSTNFCHSRESKVIVLQTANFHSASYAHTDKEYYIFSYWVTVSQAVYSCNLMFWIKGNDAIAPRTRKAAPQNFSKYRLTKKLWKCRLRRKIRISGSERQIMSGTIIRFLVRSLFFLSSMGRRSPHLDDDTAFDWSCVPLWCRISLKKTV